MCKLLARNGCRVVVIDDGSGGQAQTRYAHRLEAGSIGDRALLDRVLASERIVAAVGFAGSIQVGESVRLPLKYHTNNVSNLLVLLQALVDHGVPRFIFSSTAAVYGDPRSTPIDEQHPMAPINPYGRSKLFIEQVLQEMDAAHCMRSVCLRYFNAAGADPDGELGECHEPETHLIPLAIRAALGTAAPLQVFGDDHPTADGTCIRDYIHVSDLVDAHLLALRHLLEGGESRRYNLGNGAGHSVREVLLAVQRQAGKAVPHAMVGRRAGDPPVLVADATRIRRDWGWSPRYPELDVMVAHALRWERGRTSAH